MEIYALRARRYLQYDGTNTEEVRAWFQSQQLDPATASIISAAEESPLRILVDFDGWSATLPVNPTDWISDAPAEVVTDELLRSTYITGIES